MINNCSFYKLDNLQMYTSAIRTEQMDVTTSYHELNPSITVTMRVPVNPEKVVLGNKTETAQ